MLAAVILVMSLAAPRSEPRYRGKSLTSWLKIYDSFEEGEAARAEAANAVRHIGTNAIPYLLTDLGHHPPAWMETVSNLIRGWPQRFINVWQWLIVSQDRNWRAELGFQILGADATPAVPRLILMLNDRIEDYEEPPAAEALASIGQPALIALMGTLTNRANSGQFRAAAVQAIGEMETNANEVTEQLVACLEDEPEVAIAAALALGSVVVDKEALVPKLVAILNPPRKSSGCIAGITALRIFGTNAQSAVPVLRTFLTSETPELRCAATNALDQIHPWSSR